MTVEPDLKIGPSSSLVSRTEPTGSPRNAKHARRPPFNPVFVSWLLLVLGCLLRLREYLANPSIWNDEAELALNIIDRSYGGLTHPLASAQGAPIGFLFIEKTAIEVFGSREMALRLGPFLASIVLVIVFRSLAMRTLRGWIGCLAIALVAVSPTLVYFSTDAKQYSSDATCVVILTWLTMWVIDKGFSVRSVIIWAVSAGIAVWISFPAAFAAGIGSVVLIVLARRNTKDLLRIVVASAIWIAAFGVEYFVSLRTLHSNQALLNFWAPYLAPLQGSKTSWVYHTALSAVRYPFDLLLTPLALILLLAGAVGLVWRRLSIGLFTLILCGVTLFSGLVREYPVGDRMVLFLVPFSALLLAGCLLLVERHRWVPLVLVLVVSASTFGSAVVALGQPYTMTSGKQAMQYAIAHSGPDSLVLIEGTVTNLYDYYHQTAGITVAGSVTLFPPSAGTTSCSPTQETAFLRNYKEVWVVFAPPGTMEPPAALNQYRNALEASGKTEIVERLPGNTGVLLVHPGLHPDGATSIPKPSWESGPFGCLSFYLP